MESLFARLLGSTEPLRELLFAHLRTIFESQGHPLMRRLLVGGGPQLAIQTRPCFDSEQVTIINAQLISAFGSSIHLLSSCSGDNGRIGMWLGGPPSDAGVIAARQSALDRVELFDDGDTAHDLAFFAGVDLVAMIGDAQWRRFNFVQPGFSGHSLRLIPRDKVRVTVHGGPYGVGLVFTDRLYAADGELRWESSGHFQVSDDEGGVDLDPSKWSSDGGPGAALERMLPKSTLSADAHDAFVFDDDAIDVEPYGILFLGRRVRLERKPRVTIRGNLRPLATRSTTQQGYDLLLSDFLHPHSSWSGDGRLIASKDRYAAFEFDLSGAKPGELVPRTVRVSVTDVGLAAPITAELTVEIIVVPPKGSHPPGPPPPIRPR